MKTVEDKNLSGVLNRTRGKFAKKSICSRPDIKLNVSVMLLGMMEMPMMVMPMMAILAVKRQT